VGADERDDLLVVEAVAAEREGRAERDGQGEGGATSEGRGEREARRAREGERGGRGRRGKERVSSTAPDEKRKRKSGTH